MPLFPEALLLHHLDNLDSKMESMRAFLQKDRHVEGCWTGYNASLERSVLKKDKFLEDPEPCPAPDATAPPPVQPSLPALIPVAVSPEPPAKPQSAPVTRPAAPQFRPQSLFGEKLQGALHKDS